MKWIKITTDIFDDEKIQLIESMPDAYAIITCWFKLLCLAGKSDNDGVLMLGRAPYTDDMLSVIFRMNKPTVQLALATFQQFGMVEITEDGVITISNWSKHQSLSPNEKKKEYDRNYAAERREQKKLEGESRKSRTTNRTTNRTTVVSPSYSISISKEDKNKGCGEKEKKQKYGEYQNVLLSGSDIEKLKAEFPSDWQDWIERLSEYIASTGKSYKSHLATIRSWARKDKPKGQQEPQKRDYGGENFWESFDEGGGTENGHNRSN